MSRFTTVALITLVIVLLSGAAYVVRARAPLPFISARSAADTDRAPTGVRVRVEVVNTTRVRGLARRATRVLRERGFDVVSTSTSSQTRDTTLVLDRSGHAGWVSSVAHILGPAARTEVRVDSSRYLDITVLLGSSWHPPSQPLNP